jgi:arsenate reductase
MSITIYHNPRCSKSRATLALLMQRGVAFDVIDYLETPPDAATLDGILKALGCEPRALMRTQEAPYRELELANPTHTRAHLIEAMVAHPILIERPIVLANDKAVIGRPPENIAVLFDQ